MGPNLSYITTSNPPLDSTLTNSHTQRIERASELGKETFFSSSKSMVSLQASLSQGERKVSPNFEAFSSKKRKWQEGGGEKNKREEEEFTREPKSWKKEQAYDIELHLDAPLPLEWQRCLDIKSGQIHFYNTRTHKRTSKDPRSSPEPPPPPSSSPSLDLELNLNLACNPSTTTKHVDQYQQVQTKHELKHKIDLNSSKSSSCSPSRISLDIDRQEMVAAVCMRCHMLVMMCKATPSCPNCKFAHPQG